MLKGETRMEEFPAESPESFLRQMDRYTRRLEELSRRPRMDIFESSGPGKIKLRLRNKPFGVSDG